MEWEICSDSCALCYACRRAAPVRGRRRAAVEKALQSRSRWLSVRLRRVSPVHDRLCASIRGARQKARSHAVQPLGMLRRSGARGVSDVRVEPACCPAGSDWIAAPKLAGLLVPSMMHGRATPQDRRHRVSGTPDVR